MNKVNGLALAAATAALLTGCNTMAEKMDSAEMKMKAAASDAKGKCVGGNSCKGTSLCATATSSCQGHNACKGQGFIMATKADCEAAGGEIEAK